jgi:imidazolonepropionase-like amidohydrolase
MKKLLALACMAGATAWAAGDASFLLRGGTVHTVAGADIAGGAVLVENGRIVEVGAHVAAPKGVRVVDVRGLHVYPGMIDSATEMGLREIDAVRETNDVDEIGDFHPQVRAIVAVNPASEHIAVTRANGITSVVSLPQGGILCGQAALIHLDGGTWEEMEIRGSVAADLRFPVIADGRGGPRGAEPPPFAERKRDREKKLRELHEYFEAARRYRQAKAAGDPELKRDLGLEALLPVIEGKQPLLVAAMPEKTILEALAFAEREKVHMILAGGQEAYKVAGELKAKGVPVILMPTLSLPKDEDDPYDKPYTQPAELYKAGVKFAFGSFTTSGARNLPYQAAMAVAFGLPYAEALKAVTLGPAEIWGVGEELGSIEKGKWADLMVTDGDPLETRTEVRQLYIKGRTVDLENKHRRLYERYLKR